MKLKNLLLLPMFIGGSYLLSGIIPASAAGTLTITSPQTGQTWAAGSTQTITWTPSNPTSTTYGQTVPTANITLNFNSPCTATSTSSCSGTTSTPYIVAENVPDSGTYSWNVPSTISITYQGPATLTVGLSDSSAQGTSGQFYLGTSNSTASSPPLLAPNGGEMWALGSSQTIQWSSATSTASSVNINLVPINVPACTSSCATAGSGTYPIASNVPNSGSYSWTINSSSTGTPIPTGQYTVTVSDASTGNVIGSSAGLFTITASGTSASSTMPVITGLNPNSGLTGQLVNIIGSGFAAAGNSVLFGTGTYINNLTSANGMSLQFTVPSQTQPCPPNNSGACSLAIALITPGAYGVSVSNDNGTSNSLPFEVTGMGTSSPASTQASGTPTGLQIPTTGTFLDGTLVIVNGTPTVYLVRSGQFVPFTNPQIFLAHGYQWSQIQNITPAQLNPQDVSSMFVLAPDGSIIKGSSDPTIYLVTNNGQKSAIPSMDVFSRLNLNLKNLIKISDQELQNYPSAPAQQ